MSPPAVTLDADGLHRSQDAAFANMAAATEFGRFAISVGAPRAPKDT